MKPNKKPKSYSKKELDKIRKQTGACEHDQVSYKSLEDLNEKLMWRLRKDFAYEEARDDCGQSNYRGS